MKLVRLAAALLAVAAIAVGATSIATAGGSAPAKPAVKHAKVVKKHAVRKTAESPGESASTENDADAAAQDKACTAAGIDPNGSNVNYDDATGTCTNG
jgi:hypothetical protein